MPNSVLAFFNQVAGAESSSASTASAARIRSTPLRPRRRDLAPFETIVRSHRHRVYNFCARMLGDREEALDVTQEIFLCIFDHLGSFRFDSTLSTWIFRIARNHCLNRLKYLKRRGRDRSESYGPEIEGAITEALGGAARPDDDLHCHRERAAVHRAIDELDDDQRVLVLLRDVEGLSYEEIVSITGLALGTVKSRLHRAREKLAAKIHGLQFSRQEG